MEVNKEEQIRYFNEQLPHVVIASPKLTNNEKILYLCLLYHFQQKETCYPSYNTLSKESKIGKNGSVSRILNKLEWKKLIKIHHSRQVDLPNVYAKCKIGEVARRKLGTADYVKVDHFEKISHAVIAAHALSNDAKILYCILRYHSRQKNTCFVGYELLLKETQVSRATLSRCIKQLEETKLIEKEERRHTHQSTIYHLLPITRTNRELLKREYNDLLAEIKSQEKETKITKIEKKLANIREIKYQIRRSLKVCLRAIYCLFFSLRKYASSIEINYLYKVAVSILLLSIGKDDEVQSYKQSSKSVEVHFDPEKNNSPTENIYTSSKINMSISITKNNENKEKNAFEKFKPKLPEALQQKINLLKTNPENEPCAYTLSSCSEIFMQNQNRLDEMTASIEKYFGDDRHSRENKSRTQNIYTRVRSNQIEESQFLEQMVTVKALIKERVEEGKFIKNRMAYFYKMLENRFSINSFHSTC